MNSLSLLLSWRYLVKTKQERSINTMIKICFLGIALGTFSLALVVAVMRGFERATHEHMQGIHAHIIMQAYGNEPLDFDAITRVLKNEFPEIIGIAPSNQHYGIIQNDSGQLSMLISIKGIDPSAESETTSLEKKILGNETLKNSVHENHVAIGEKLATKLHTSNGNQFQLLFAPETQDWSKTIHLDSANLIVGGVFKTGIEEFDSSLILCTLQQAQELFPDAGITSVQLKLKPKSDETALIKKLKKRFNLDCYSWKELYPALLAALKLEKYASFFILSLIILVASMSIISLLFMQITQKKTDIAILQTLGTSFTALRTIFFLIGFSIALCACIIGLMCAFLIGLLLKHYVHIELPDAYFASHLPIALDPEIFFIVFCVVMILSCLAAFLSIRKIDDLLIANTLKN